MRILALSVTALITFSAAAGEQLLACWLVARPMILLVVLPTRSVSGRPVALATQWAHVEQLRRCHYQWSMCSMLPFSSMAMTMREASRNRSNSAAVTLKNAIISAGEISLTALRRSCPRNRL